MKGRFFEHEFLVPDCSKIINGHSGNCLSGNCLIKWTGIRPKVKLDSGEDFLFFRRLHERGGILVYAAKAIAVETVPETRITIGYLWRRPLRWGSDRRKAEPARQGVLGDPAGAGR